MEMLPSRYGRHHALACAQMCMVWAQQAQGRFGFPAPTARRLAFIRWLYATGRLADGPTTAPPAADPLAPRVAEARPDTVSDPRFPR